MPAVLPVLLLDMSSRETHVCVHRDTCISMFFAKLLVIEEIEKIFSIYRMSELIIMQSLLKTEAGGIEPRNLSLMFAPVNNILKLLKKKKKNNKKHHDPYQNKSEYA